MSDCEFAGVRLMIPFRFIARLRAEKQKADRVPEPGGFSLSSPFSEPDIRCGNCIPTLMCNRAHRSRSKSVRACGTERCESLNRQRVDQCADRLARRPSRCAGSPSSLVTAAVMLAECGPDQLGTSVAKSTLPSPPTPLSGLPGRGEKWSRHAANSGVNICRTASRSHSRRDRRAARTAARSELSARLRLRRDRWHRDDVCGCRGRRRCGLIGVRDHRAWRGESRR